MKSHFIIKICLVTYYFNIVSSDLKSWNKHFNELQIEQSFNVDSSDKIQQQRLPIHFNFGLFISTVWPVFLMILRQFTQKLAVDTSANTNTNACWYSNPYECNTLKAQISEDVIQVNSNETNEQRSTQPTDIKNKSFKFVKTTPTVNILEQLKLQQLLLLHKLQQPQESARAPSARQRKKKKKRRRKKPQDKKRKKKKKPQQHTLGQPAHVIFATVTKKPNYHYYGPTTTKAPITKPTSKLKYLWKKHDALKKKKKKYFHHLFEVFYPFVKFVAFFTVLNPFTLAVFLFSLISPVVFSFLGFVALSSLVKPFLHLVFDIKRNVGNIKQQKLTEQRRRERRKPKRPVTIHKHYYHDRPIQPPKSHQYGGQSTKLTYGKEELLHGAAFGPKFVRFEKINYSG